MKNTSDGMTRVWNRSNSWIGLISLLVLFAVGSFAPSAEAAPKGQRFDHFKTGFEITGAHKRAKCESCHKDGVFKGTPKKCKGCHSRNTRIQATPEPNDRLHTVAGKNNCSNCHETLTFTGAKFHTEGVVLKAAVACSTCHSANGGAQKPPSDEIHVDALSQGRDCGSCHSVGKQWHAAVVDHTDPKMQTNCVRCHRDNKLNLAGHFKLDTCENCHSYPSFSNGRMDHTNAEVLTTECSACHRRVQPLGKAASPKNDQFHLSATVASQSCGNCHSPTQAWTAAKVDHASFGPSDCYQCHANDKSGVTAHAPLTMCGACHAYSTGFTQSNMDHAARGSATCRSCHNRVTPLGTAEGPPNDSYHTTGAAAQSDCGSSGCHSVNVPFGSAGVDHTLAANQTNCARAGCHLGKDAEAPAPHVGLTSCHSCHSRNAGWASANMDHSAVGGKQCKTCHSRTQPLGLAEGPPNDTFHTSGAGAQSDCGSSGCHSVNVAFASAKIDHTLATNQMCALRLPPGQVGRGDGAYQPDELPLVPQLQRGLGERENGSQCGRRHAVQDLP